MNFDMPQTAKKEDVPKNGSEIEFVPPTEEEVARFEQLVQEGKARNEELGGDGKILSLKEKAADWYGESDSSESGWALGLEKSSPVSMQEEKEEPVDILKRQLDDIAIKRAGVMSQLIQATDEGEKARLRALSDALQKGHELKFNEYKAHFPTWEEDGGSEVVGEDRLAAA